MKRVFLQFSFRQGWFCEFLEEDRKTRLPGTAMLPDERKLFELVSAVVSPEHFRAPGDRGRDQEETRRCLAGAHAGAVCKAAATSGKLDKITSSFPHHVLRLLVITQSDKARVPEVIVRHPLREFELPDEDRLHPATVLYFRRRQPHTPRATSRFG